MTQPAPQYVLDWLTTRLDVSRETSARLGAYVALLEKWQQRINLIGPKTAAEIWQRHILDSAQLVPYLDQYPGKLADFGAGAGLPGLVVALLTERPVVLVEANTKKAVFLREAIRVTAAPAQVLHHRLERLAPLEAAVITARAFAPLPRLLEYGANHLAPGGCYVLLKGRDMDREIQEARRDWRFSEARYPSQSDPDGGILILSEVHRD